MTEVQPRFKTPKLKSTPKARRRRRAEIEYAQQRNWTLSRSGGRCEARFAPDCSGRASQTHHVVPRSRGGDNMIGNLLAVCRQCHAAIHAHPELARGHGLLLHRRDTA